jgi:hypothetical protein
MSFGNLFIENIVIGNVTNTKSRPGNKDAGLFAMRIY